MMLPPRVRWSTIAAQSRRPVNVFVQPGSYSFGPMLEAARCRLRERQFELLGDHEGAGIGLVEAMAAALSAQHAATVIKTGV